MGKFKDILTSLNPFSPTKEASNGLPKNFNNPNFWLSSAVLGGVSSSGAPVTPETVYQLTSYYAAVRNISEDIGKLPMFIFENVVGGRRRAPDHPLFDLLNMRPSPLTSAQDFYQDTTGHAINYGNGYAEIVRNGRGAVVELILIHPSRVEPVHIGEAGRQRLWYRVHGSGTTINNEQFNSALIPDRDMIHIKGFGDDGIVGYPVWQLAAESMGIALATQRFVAKYFANSASLSGVLTKVGKLTDEEYDRLRTSWNKTYTGSNNANKVAILEGDATFQTISSSAKEAQLIENRGFSVLEAARLLRIPPHKIASVEGAALAKANLEEQNLEYHSDTLDPWRRRWMMELSFKLLTKPFFAEQPFNALTLGNSATRSATVRTLISTGVLTPNEGREVEGLNASDVEGMNDFFMQGAMVKVEQIASGETTTTGGGDSSSDDTTDDESDDNPVDPETGDEPAEDEEDDQMVDASKIIMAHKPTFDYAAKRIVDKENKAVSNQIKINKKSDEEFEQWAQKTFEKQKTDIIDAFSAPIEAINNMLDEDSKLENIDFLSRYADNYAENGVNYSVMLWKCRNSDNVKTPDLDEQAGKMSQNVMNELIEAVKGAENA